MTWYRWHPTEGVDELSEEALRCLWEVAAASDSDYTNAVFAAVSPGGAQVAYLTPSARLLASAIGAQPCERPAGASLRLIAGDPRAWAAHFGPGRGGAPDTGYDDTMPDQLAPTRPLPLS